MNFLKIKLVLISVALTFIGITSSAQITDTGTNVGIGQSNPLVMLHLGSKGGLSSGNSNGATQLSHNFKFINGYSRRIAAGFASRMVYGNDGQIYFQTADNKGWNKAIAWKHALYIKNDGKISIGESGPHNIVEDDPATTSIVEGDYKLFVEKGILTEKIKCAIADGTDWADYVFEEDYEMMDINDLEGFVTENKHLPNVPSAEEMVANGLDVAKMDAKLLEKIEEAYLYIIDINKEMKAMNEKVDALATENESLKSSLQSLNTSGN